MVVEHTEQRQVVMADLAVVALRRLATVLLAAAQQEVALVVVDTLRVVLQVRQVQPAQPAILVRQTLVGTVVDQLQAVRQLSQQGVATGAVAAAVRVVTLSYVVAAAVVVVADLVVVVVGARQLALTVAGAVVVAVQVSEQLK